MKVNWKYDMLFSFNVTFPPGLRPNDFFIIPTVSCRGTLKKHNLLFKAVENGGLVISEKRIFPDESTEPVWKIRDLTAFTFILHLRNNSLFPRLRPYSSDPNAVLPEFFGRRRLLYFDNLNDELEPDQDLTPIPQTLMENIDFNSLEIAAAGSVSDQDLASLVPNDFLYRRENGITQITFSPLRPETAEDLEYELTDEKPQVELSLAQSAYRFERSGSSGSSSEIVFAGTELLAASSFGVIQIYKNEATDYNTAIRYDINFEES